jgi:hypothetical protein
MTIEQAELIDNPFNPTSPAGKCYESALTGDIWAYEAALEESSSLTALMFEEFTEERIEWDFSDEAIAEDWEARLMRSLPPETCYTVGTYSESTTSLFLTREAALNHVSSRYAWAWDDQCQGTGMALPEGSVWLRSPDGLVENI